MIKQLKRWLPANVVARLKMFNRVRWLTKYRLLRGSGFWRSDPLAALSHLLFDPELESYTFELKNEPAIIDSVGQAMDAPAATVARYSAEAHTDPELNDRLTAAVRWRPETKRRLPLGARLLWYLLVRIRKPQLVVETGVLLGLGSLTILRALERNAADGFPGRLISVDVDPAAGWLVPPRLRGPWTLLTGLSTQVLPAALAGERVGILFQDTLHTYENQLAEFGLALAHGDSPLILADPAGDRSPALEELCRRYGGERFVWQPVPRRHFHVPAPTAVGLFRQLPK
jgi:hypothetical protein